MNDGDDYGLGMSAREAAEAIAKVLAQVMPEAPFATQERLALEVTNEAVREFIRERLQGLADEFRGDVECNGKLYRHHQEGTVTYHTLCGPVEITRPTARLSEERNGPTIVPMELAAGIAVRCTPALAYSLMHGYATEGSREVQERLSAACRLPPSRATIERVASGLGGARRRAARRRAAWVAESRRTAGRYHRALLGCRPCVDSHARGGSRRKVSP